jgi:hypothetical protein
MSLRFAGYTMACWRSEGLGYAVTWPLRPFCSVLAARAVPVFKVMRTLLVRSGATMSASMRVRRGR